MEALEKELENDYCNWLIEEYGGVALKLALIGKRGFPDRTVLCQGCLFFIEFKRLSGRYEGLQLKWRQRLQKLGFTVFEFRTLAYAKKKTREFFRKNNITPISNTCDH